MQPVIQEETTGCGIASAAAIVGISYRRARAAANKLGIYATDASLWSDPTPILKLLTALGVDSAGHCTPFTCWGSLPDCALLATKWHRHKGRAYWHWAVFVREADGDFVLDSKQALKNHRRTDFGRIKPKWFIEVHAQRGTRHG